MNAVPYHPAYSTVSSHYWFFLLNGLHKGIGEAEIKKVKFYLIFSLTLYYSLYFISPLCPFFLVRCYNFMVPNKGVKRVLSAEV